MSLSRFIVLASGIWLAACSTTENEQQPPPPRPEPSFDPRKASDIYIEKGVTYMNSGNYQVALQDMKRAIELDDDNSEAYNAIGVLYERIDRFPEAEESFKKALSVKPDNYGARNNFGRFLCNRGRPAEAFEEFNKIIGNKLYDQPWVVLTNAGICARRAGKRGEAEGYLRKALEVAPDFPPTLLELARLSRENGQNLSARAFLERYFAATNPSPEALLLGVETEISLGNSETALEYARALSARFPDTREYVEARRLLGH